MVKSKYKFENRLWELEQQTGMSIDSITFESTGITQKVNGLCFLCRGLCLPEDKGQMKFEVERYTEKDSEGKERIYSKHIYICGECTER